VLRTRLVLYYTDKACDLGFDVNVLFDYRTRYDDIRSRLRQQLGLFVGAYPAANDELVSSMAVFTAFTISGWTVSGTPELLQGRSIASQDISCERVCSSDLGFVARESNAQSPIQPTVPPGSTMMYATGMGSIP